MHVNILFTASFCIQGPYEEENTPPPLTLFQGGGSFSQIRPLRKKIIIMSETRFLLDVFITYTLISLSFQKGSTTNLRLYFQNVLHRNPGFTCTCFKISSVSPFLNITAIFSFLSFLFFSPLLPLYLSKQLSMSPQAGYYLLSHLPLQLDQAFTASIWFMSPSYLLI